MQIQHHQVGMFQMLILDFWTNNLENCSICWVGYDKSSNAIITFRNSNLPTNSISDLGMNLIVSGNTVIKDT